MGRPNKEDKLKQKVIYLPDSIIINIKKRSYYTGVNFSQYVRNLLESHFENKKDLSVGEDISIYLNK